MTPPAKSANAPARPDLTSSLTQWLDYMQQIHVSAIDMGLSRVLPVAERLQIITSAKQDAYVFTVAGTNGKGSTTATIAQICQSAGYKTALYQSPHLLEFNERVRIDGVPVSDERLITAFHEVEMARLACELTLSFFEMTTLAAFLIFAEAKCDVWVLEVGLGGRLDVVNIIDPNLAVITNVGIDHVDWLGDTREKIGFEKAGILREGLTLVYGEADMPESVKAQIEKLNVTCYQAGQDFAYLEGSSVLEGDKQQTEDSSWQYSNAAVTMNLPKPKLSLINTSNAISAALASPLEITQGHIAAALQQVSLAGRFDRRALLGRQWLFDVAHNERGVAFLLAQLIPLWHAHKKAHPEAKLLLLFSMLADKDIAQVVQLLVQSGLPISGWYVATIDHPRAASQNQLADVLSEYVVEDGGQSSRVEYADTLAEATQQVVADSQVDDFILVCGSFHTIAESLLALTQDA